jgi:hypothetical protein
LGEIYLHWHTPWKNKKYSIALEGKGGTTTGGGRRGTSLPDEHQTRKELSLFRK